MAASPTAFRDPAGNGYVCMQWDGDPATAEAMATWSQNRVTFEDGRGTLGFVRSGIRHHIGQGDWVCMQGSSDDLIVVRDSYLTPSFIRQA